MIVIACLIFSIVPVSAGPDGTIIEDVSYDSFSYKLTPLLMDKVMEYDDEEQIPVIIKFKDSGKISKMAASVSSMIEDAGGERGFEFETIKGMSAKIPKNELNQLAMDDNIEKIYYDRMYPVPEDKSDGGYDIEMQSSVFSIDSDALWTAGYNGTGIIVSVIDTGVNYTHADLGGCSQATFLAGSCAKVPKGYDFINGDNNPIDDHGHGTHVAGTVAANGGIKGVAPGATLYAAKVCDLSGCPESVMIAALEWSFDNGADIATMSIGGPSYINDGSDPLPVVIDRLIERGMIITIASGNEGPGTSTIASPGSAKNAITVGAATDSGTNSTSDDAMADFSCRGPSLFGRLDPDVSAPGVLINSTSISGTYTIMSGTSMATPHVAGAAALLLDIHPSWAPEEVRGALMRTSRTMGYHVFEEGPGMINASRAAFENASVTVGGDDLDRIETIIEPEDEKDFDFNLYNNYATALNFTFSVSDLTDLEEGNTIASGNITLPDSEIVDADDSTISNEMTIAVPAGTEPGIYGGILNVTHNESSLPLIIPIVVAVPQVGSGTIVGIANNDVSGSIDEWGDFITYPLKVDYNTSSYKIGLGWTDSGNDLDLYMYGQEDEFGYIVDWSNSVNPVENISLASPLCFFPSSGYYWLNVHNYDLSSTNPETYTLTISNHANLTVEPRDIDMNVTIGSTNSTNITITNDGTPRTVHVEPKIYEQRSNYTNTSEIPDEGFCKMYYLSNYSTTYGLDLIDEYTTRLDVYMNWTASSNDMALKIFTWEDDGDKVLENGEFGNPFYGGGEFIFMSDSGNYTNESIAEYGIWNYFNDPSVDDILICARTDENTTTDNFYIDITTYGYAPYDVITATPSTVSLSASESENVTITVNATNLTTDNYTTRIFIDGSPNYAEFEVDFQALPDTESPTWNSTSVSPATYSKYAQGASYQFNISCFDNSAVYNVIIEFDGTNYSYRNAQVSKSGDVYSYTVGDLVAGSYDYKWFVNDTSNFWNNTISYTYDINKTDNYVNLTINGNLNGNATIMYGTNASVTAAALVLPTLYREGSSVSNPDFGIFAAGSYAYKANATGNENYSANATGRTHYLNILQAPTSTRLYLNGSQANKVYTTGDIANISALLNISQLVIIETNFSGSMVQLANGTGSAQSLKNTSELTESEVYNITAYFSGNTNYTGSSVSYTLAVCPVCPEPSNWTDCVSKSQNRTNYYCNSTSNYICQDYIQTQSCGSSGGGGGGSGSTKEYNISQNLTGGPVGLSLGQGSKAHFGYKNQEHTATVKTLGGSYVVLLMQSDIQELVIYIGQTGKFDLDGDGTDDISVKFSGISSDKAILVFDIIEEVKTTALPPMMPAEQPEITQEPDLTSELEPDKYEEPEQDVGIDMTAILVVLGILFVLGLFKIYAKSDFNIKKSTRTKRTYEEWV